MANVLFTKTSNTEFVIEGDFDLLSDALFIEPNSFDLTSDTVFLGNGDTPFVPGGIILNPIPCRNVINDCECIDSPFANFSAELPDQDRFLAVTSVFNPPPLNQFGVLGCKAWCWSEASQADAELCAVAQATLCGNPPDTPSRLVGNTAQTCDYTCPTGGVSSYTVAANQVYESTQSAADALAFSIACIGAESNAHCIPPPQPPGGGPPPAGGSCDIFASIVWGNPNVGANGSASGSGNSFEASVGQGSGSLPVHSGIVGSVSYTGGEIDCHVFTSVTKAGPGAGAGISITVDNVPVLNTTGTGDTDWEFTIPASVNANIVINVFANAGGCELCFGESSSIQGSFA